jgi:hypothetical protein
MAKCACKVHLIKIKQCLVAKYLIFLLQRLVHPVELMTHAATVYLIPSAEICASALKISFQIPIIKSAYQVRK